jgi:hypothetical protein
LRARHELSAGEGLKSLLNHLHVRHFVLHDEKQNGSQNLCKGIEINHTCTKQRPPNLI